jgi:hypothetical protein
MGANTRRYTELMYVLPKGKAVYKVKFNNEFGYAGYFYGDEIDDWKEFCGNVIREVSVKSFSMVKNRSQGLKKRHYVQTSIVQEEFVDALIKKGYVEVDPFEAFCFGEDWMDMEGSNRDVECFREFVDDDLVDRMIQHNDAQREKVAIEAMKYSQGESKEFCYIWNKQEI